MPRAREMVLCFYSVIPDLVNTKKEEKPMDQPPEQAGRLQAAQRSLLCSVCGTCPAPASGSRWAGLALVGAAASQLPPDPALAAQPTPTL